MNYAKIVAGAVAQYPITGTDVLRQNPGVSFPRGPLSAGVMEAYGCKVVAPVPVPAHNPNTHRVEEGTPVFRDGAWWQTWQLRALDATEIAERQRTLEAQIVSSVQARLDAFAQTRGYDGILSACTYATDPNPRFAAEGQYCVTARGNTWAVLYALLAEVQAGKRPVPADYAAVEPLLPVLGWPA